MSKHWLLAIGSALLVVVYIAVSRGVSLPPCMFYEVTGFYCPGCGSTRAVLRLIHGDIAGALRANALLFIVVPFLIFLAGSQIRWFGRCKPSDIPSWVGFTTVIVLIIYWIARNIPTHPFSLLAPR